MFPLSNFTSSSSEILPTFYNNTSLIFRRCIYSITSICFCFFIIILYLILCIQVFRRRRKTRGSVFHKSITSSEPEIQAPQDKIGLGSHFMFSLIISDLLCSIIPILFYILTSSKKEDEASLLSFLKTLPCKVLGFFHNYLDLMSVCWTTVLMNLFYKSTFTVEFRPGEEKKSYVKGFLYSIVSPLCLTVPAFIWDVYGFADTHCSLNDFDDSLEKNVFKYMIAAFFGVNLIVNLAQLVRVIHHYRKRLKIFKGKHTKEYKVILLYVIIFYCFPIYLIVSRVFKGLNREINQRGGSIFTGLKEIGSILTCLNGGFNSLLCCYFFRGVYTCKCCNREDNGFVMSETEIPEKKVLVDDGFDGDI